MIKTSPLRSKSSIMEIPLGGRASLISRRRTGWVGVELVRMKPRTWASFARVSSGCGAMIQG